MDLRIASLKLSNFRNYRSYELDAIGDLTIFIGRNAIGKTNLLEAIHLVTSGGSFRHPQISQLIYEGEKTARVQLDSTDGNRQISTVLQLEPGKKRFSVNGKAKQTSDVKGLLPSVAFVPDDLSLAKGSSSIKRDAIDALGSQLSKNYYVLQRDYDKALRYKNRLLKEESHPSLIDAIDETLVMCGSRLFRYRVALFNRLIPLVQENYREISESSDLLSARYAPSWCISGFDAETEGEYSPEEAARCMVEELARKRNDEIARHRSLVGPHNDKISFFIAGRDTSSFASQGQQRSVVLAWKLAEVEMIRQTIGTKPVLLLDDVMSELDDKRRSMLVKLVDGDVQTFISSTDLTPFGRNVLDVARIVELRDGPDSCQ